MNSVQMQHRVELVYVCVATYTYFIYSTLHTTAQAKRINILASMCYSVNYRESIEYTYSSTKSDNRLIY